MDPAGPVREAARKMKTPTRWFATRGEDRHSLELAEARLRLTTDRGTPESFGGNDVPYPRFLRSAKLQDHVRDVFGADVLEAVLVAARERSA